MSVRVEVWIDCDHDDCDNALGPMLTEMTARNVAKAARWMEFQHLYEGLPRPIWWCPTCIRAMPST